MARRTPYGPPLGSGQAGLDAAVGHRQSSQGAIVGAVGPRMTRTSAPRSDCRRARRSPHGPRTFWGRAAYRGRVVDDEVLDASPGDRARAAADALGDRELTAWCGDLVARRVAWGDPAGPDVGWVGGRAARGWGSPGRLDDTTDYWARVWAARTLLYVWDDACSADLVAGLGDPAWRVREMCAKVCARWEVARAADACAGLVEDAVPRVRAAAVRVLGVAGEGEHVEPVRAALEDPDGSVQRAAERALRTLERRLDRPL